MRMAAYVAPCIAYMQADDFDSIRDMGEPLHVISDCLRSLIKAGKGKEFIAVDFSSIEACVLAWVANEPEALEVFRQGTDIYCHAASGIYDRPITAKDKDERQVGKVAVLALGYGGGVGAFQSMAKNYGVKVPDREAEKIKKAWRDAHPNIRKLWDQLEDAAIGATDHPGEIVVANRYVSYRRKGSFLQCRLPSGRLISYPYPKTEICGHYMEDGRLVKVREADLRLDPKYLTRVDKNETWEKRTLFHRHRVNAAFVQRSTYGGSLCENVVQAIARDLLVEAIKRFEDAGHKVVLHVHDEVVVEAKRNTLSVEEAEKIMSIVPDWAKGCPIAAEGWKGERYRK